MIQCLANQQKSDHPGKLLLANSLPSVGNGKICKRITSSTTESIK